MTETARTVGSVPFVRLQSSSFRGFTLTHSNTFKELLLPSQICSRSAKAFLTLQRNLVSINSLLFLSLSGY